jgi:hypothetical protein
MPMRTDRHLAINLRKLGKSYNDINQILGIPKSTLSDWFNGNPWSAEIQKDLTRKAQILAAPKLRLMSAANKMKWDSIHYLQQQEAEKEFSSLTRNPAFLAGLMLYWGEGDKIMRNGHVRLTNSDPELIKIFYLFLHEALSIPKEKVNIYLILYPELNDNICKRYWSKCLGIPLCQFKNSATIVGRHPTRRLSYGICMIGLNSREIKEKIFTWIRLYQVYFNRN